MTTPPPRDSSYNPFTPVSKGQKLLAGLYDDWEEVTPHAGEEECTRMVPKCSSLAPQKHAANINSSSSATSKTSSLSPARDLNSNSLSYDQVLLSLYSQDGKNDGKNDLPSQVSNHPSPSTFHGRMARKPCAGGTAKPSSMSSTVVCKKKEGDEGDKEDKEDSIEHFLGMILIDRSPVGVEQALAICNLPVISVLEVEDLLSRSKDKVDRLVRNNDDRMRKLHDIGKQGLFHWSGEGNLKMTCLGVMEDKQVERGRRTRSSIGGAVTRGRADEWESDLVDTEDGGVAGNEGDREDDIYDFDEGDDALKKKSVNPSKKFKFIDDDDEWLVKPSKGKGRGKGRGRPRKLGGRGGKSNLLLPTNNVGNYFPTVGKNSQEEVPYPAAQDISVAETNKQEQDEWGSASTVVSPITAACNRVLLGTGVTTYTRTRTERRGACPMCSKEFGMTVLEIHAQRCQGEK